MDRFVEEEKRQALPQAPRSRGDRSSTSNDTEAAVQRIGAFSLRDYRGHELCSALRGVGLLDLPSVVMSKDRMDSSPRLPSPSSNASAPARNRPGRFLRPAQPRRSVGQPRKVHYDRPTRRGRAGITSPALVA
jgi:hypothetical protein